MTDACYLGCINMVTAAIKDAIDEYVKHYRTVRKDYKIEYKFKGVKNKTDTQKNLLEKAKRHILEFESAKRFLFNPRYLEAQLNNWGLDVDINYIRRKAQDKAENYHGGHYVKYRVQMRQRKSVG